MLAYGAAVWCLDPPVRIKRKLNIMQRPFLLAPTGAYRTTATSSLEVILRIPPPYLQLQQEAGGTEQNRTPLHSPVTIPFGYLNSVADLKWKRHRKKLLNYLANNGGGRGMEKVTKIEI
ncbi:hypothetical protein AVEN_17529-1 [Araneus ventricosus]|uniref:Uncharacterized protein n=1 Tax=Araneus ventricosus TaxID=182803 RepID=A0A4Y2HF92_ARAVE|nr:hypothetical protein AVEN_17529-1 [Araneus ventricosus]